MVGYAYATEFFIAWYGGNPNESFAFVNRAFGPYAWAYWIMVSCNVITPQLFWFKKIRTTMPVMWVIYIFVNIGMWFERFVITVTSLSRDFLPSSWGYYQPTIGRHPDLRRQLRPLLHPGPAVHPLPAHGGHGRGQDRDADRRRPQRRAAPVGDYHGDIPATRAAGATTRRSR